MDMEKIVKDRVLEILGKILIALKKKDNYTLNVLSNYTIHNASVFQDQDSIGIAIIAYSLSKIIQRYKFDETKEWLDFYNLTLKHLKNARNDLSNNNIEPYKNTLKELFKAIDEFDHKLALYVQQVIEESKVKKGSAMFEHGISLSQVSELLGISMWDLMTYIGKTKVMDAQPEIRSAADKLNFTRKLFGLK